MIRLAHQAGYRQLDHIGTSGCVRMAESDFKVMLGPSW